ncbi:Clp protease N-terminal domain-containing protein [Blastococcus sp. TF02A-26]|uniref:Clp protease N-terminal domain-containing protein n=1 Tax=Blastococcus sp. TF02A-26 TaxID=2250577 RepID=UPI0018F5A2BB|nr:Clp protease N-terminal domain-containing protein [Blastococcus sp. TF02A-26]
MTAIRDIRTIKRLLTGAETEARAAGEAVPGPEHLLLSAAELPDGTAGRALAAVDTDVAALRAAVTAVHDDALTGLGLDAGPAPALAAPATGPLRTSPQAQQVFQRAVELSRSATPAGLRGAHVVAAAAELERGTAARALRRLGIERDQVLAAARVEGGVPA